MKRELCRICGVLNLIDSDGNKLAGCKHTLGVIKKTTRKSAGRDQRNEEIRAARIGGKTLRWLANLHGISISNVGRICNTVPKRKKNPKKPFDPICRRPDVIKTIRLMRARGDSYRTIGAVVGLSGEAVGRICRARAMKKRPGYRARMEAAGEL